MPKIVTVSGGFDPIHIGHVRMIREARALGDELVVILNNDNWLMAKKGFVFMPEAERQEIIEALEGVSKVVLTKHVENDPDRSVCGALREIRPDIFANGGDRFADNIPEAILAKELGIELVFGIGRGGKVQSSTWLAASDRETRLCFCDSKLLYKDCHGKSKT
jgi:cytidyltransferase-like protein